VTQSDSAPGARERAWLVAAGVVATAGVAARIHNAFAYPPLQDFDAAGHALNAFSLYQGQLPDPHFWSGFHPPLYYAIAGLLWHALPESIPVHTSLRLLSAAAGFGAVAIVWATLRRCVSAVDAAVVTALVACVPVMSIATSMLGNETSCALFTTGALARLIAIPDEPRAVTRHAIFTVLIASLAAMSKSTGLIALGVVGLTYLLRLRAAGTGTLARAALSMAAVATILLTPHYGRLLIAFRSPLAVISGGQLSDAAGNEMSTQPPGERHLVDYVSFPAVALFAPFKDAAGMTRSVPGLLYASTWADGHGQFLPGNVQAVVTAASLGAIFGLFPTVLGLAGLAKILRSPRLRARVSPLLCFSALMFGAFLGQTWAVPHYSAVKASYLLSALLPASIALAVGVDAIRASRRAIARGAVLAIAAYATFVTWWGWWV
jgi:hypothetical protein